MTNIFLYSKWLDLPLTTRHKIAKEFGIPKRGSTEVSSNVITRDGYDIKDIEKALTVEAMQKFILSKSEDVGVLIQGIIEVVEGRNVVSAPTAFITKPKKPRGKNKKAK